MCVYIYIYIYVYTIYLPTYLSIHLSISRDPTFEFPSNGASPSLPATTCIHLECLSIHLSISLRNAIQSWT